MIQEKINRLREALASVIVGQDQAAVLLMASIIADGHVLLEGVPGVAKTLMARHMAKLLGGSFSRVQFTPDLMPSDILGTEVYDPNKSEFRYHPGPIFAQVVLADEINRAPAKTQAALFEVMEERQATVSGKTYPMNSFFIIMATQNPIEQEGTYRLPEAQLDRFLCKINMSYPSTDQEVEILRRHNANAALTKLEDVTPVFTPTDVMELRKMAENVVVDEKLMRYIANITTMTRLSRNISLPASPRAAVNMMRLAKAFALMQGRDFAAPDDVRYVAPAVLCHRLQLSTEAELAGMSVTGEINRILSQASAELR